MNRTRTAILAILLVASAYPAAAQSPLLREKDVSALAQELSGEIAERNLEGITRFHRQRGSQGFHSAAEIIVERAKAYGLTDAQIRKFPADRKIYYGTQRSRPPWDAEFAELWELVNNQPGIKLASYEAEPVTLAEDSESANVKFAELIDVGDGTKESDYAGKNVKGQIVLVAAQPGAVQDEAMVDVAHGEASAGRCFGRRRRPAGERYHLTSPFCQASSRSRRRNRSVIRVEHISAMTRSAPYMLA